jgi:hypothetical protein
MLNCFHCLTSELQEVKTGHEQTLTQRQIDKPVYELSRLIQEEIAMVEGTK